MKENNFALCDQYIENLFADEGDDLKSIIHLIEENGLPQQSISASQGKFLQVMATACNAKHILEIGTFLGYSTVWLARAVADGGRVITLETDESFAKLAEQSLQRCNVNHLVELRKGPALDQLQLMMQENLPPFDLVFIDADKPAYCDYLQLCRKLCRKGSIIIADNVIRDGKVLEVDSTDEKVIGVQRFNKMLSECNDFTSTLIQTVGKKEHDGIAIAVMK